MAVDTKSEEIIELRYAQEIEDDDQAGRKSDLSTKSNGKTPNKTKVIKSASNKPKKNNRYEPVEQKNDIELGVLDDIDKEDTNLDRNEKDKKSEYDIFGRVLLSLYMILCVAIIAFMIAAFVNNDKEGFQSKMMILILCTTLITTCLSAYGLFKYGRLQDQIERLKEENRKYDMELNQLMETRDKLKKNVNELEEQIVDLENHSEDLKEQTNQFSDLVDELKQIAKDGDILDVVDDLNGNFDRMNNLCFLNEKTHLLTVYYECSFRDDDNNMDKTEYTRFLMRIDPKFRTKFKRLGNFEDICNGKESIDLKLFLEITDKILKDSNDVLGEEFMRQYSHQKTLSLQMTQQMAHSIRNELHIN